jgi:hypothetical protein
MTALSQASTAKLPPSSAEFRLAVKEILKSNSINITRSYTRNKFLKDFSIASEIWLNHRAKLRKITYVIDRDTDPKHFKKSADEILFWFTLLNQSSYIKVNHYVYGIEKFFISSWVLLSDDSQHRRK